MIWGRIDSYVMQTTQTASTVVGQQYYHYPPGVIHCDDIVVTIGSLNYPQTVIYSQHAWDLLNAIQIQPSAIPQFVFPRRDDFGIWPIPQGVYPISFKGFIRDRNLSVDDYTTGSVNVVNGSQTVAGNGTTFTSAMQGRWFEITDPTVYGQGYFYRISAFVNTTTLTLESYYLGSTANTATYRVGETPELPEEGHILLADGPTADFYAGLRSDVAKGTWFNNKFWTGDGQNNDRKFGDTNIKGGLIGIVNEYANRDDRKLIRRQPKVYPPQYKVFASVLS